MGALMNDDDWNDLPLEQKVDWLRSELIRLSQHMRENLGLPLALQSDKIKDLEKRLSGAEAGAKTRT